MKQIKTAEEVFKEHVFHYLGSVDEHNNTVPAVYNAMRAYAEQFIEQAADVIYAGPDGVNRELVLKLKEHLK